MDAKTADARTHEFDVKDVEYLRHGDKPFLARVYTPRGNGPFPALVDLHGGAWCTADRHSDKVRHEFRPTSGAGFLDRLRRDRVWQGPHKGRAAAVRPDIESVRNFPDGDNSITGGARPSSPARLSRRGGRLRRSRRRDPSRGG